MARAEDLSGEDALVALLAGSLPPARHTRLAIGDDAAALALPGGNLLLITTDMLMEGIHFRLNWGDPAALGWKALAHNLSDIAAMGGVPTHAVVALALPPGWPHDRAAALYRGLAELAASAKTEIIGGDTIRSAGPLTISLTVLGRVPARQLLTRAGARAGDALCVTGTLGRAAAGWRLLDTGYPLPEALGFAVQAQLRPTPRLAAGRALAQSGQVSAMMDLSDGVATDLRRLCHAGGVGATVERDLLPIDPVVPAACQWLAAHGRPHDAEELALAGGEDFELLFTAPADRLDALRARLAPLPLTRIGEITAAPEILLRDAAGSRPLPPGFTHAV